MHNSKFIFFYHVPVDGDLQMKRWRACTPLGAYSFVKEAGKLIDDFDQVR